MTLEPGANLGRYEIRSKIGEGGMAEVYLAEDTQLGRQVAVKFLPAELIADEQANLVQRHRGTVVAGSSRPPNGSDQPPRNKVTTMAEAAVMAAYSPMKNMANFIELYSTL